MFYNFYFVYVIMISVNTLYFKTEFRMLSSLFKDFRGSGTLGEEPGMS